MGGALATPLDAAETRTSTLDVSVAVTSACSLGTAALDFGTYDTGQGGHADVATTVSYTGCFGAGLTLELDDGQNAGGGSRGMRSAGNDILRYELYQDSARTTVLGSDGDALLLNAVAAGSGEIAVHGRIFSGQIVPLGRYTDTVGITLSF
jgi:spore coat protein U-like protein